MASPRIILGRVVEVSGTSPGPASGITYTIACHDPQVDGVFRVTNQRPVRRWPETIDTVAFEVGTMVVGVTDTSVLQWHSMEMPDFGACPDNSGQSRLLDMLKEGVVLLQDLPVPPDTVVGTLSGSSSAPSNTPAGGDA
jgi:hypothetical protein